MARIIDITQPLLSCAVYPGDPAPSAARLRTIAADGCNLTALSLCVHNGTHADAPLHFVEGGAGIGELPLDIFYGKCVVKRWDDTIPDGCERLIIKGESPLTEKDAALIVSAGVKLVGVEPQSVGEVGSPAPVHLILLGAGVIPLEGLVLRNVEEGEYVLAALPLNLGCCDGSPVRAVLIKA
jgi:arylformamidase